MGAWKPALQGWLARVDTLSDRTTARWRRLRPPSRRRVVVPYLGFGTAESVALTGRVLLDDGLRPALDTDSGWRNTARFFQQLESDELPGIGVVGELADASARAVSDDEGYFDMRLAPAPTLLASGWHDVSLRLADARPEEEVAIGRVLVPAQQAAFGIISDIDDTVVWTHATNRLRMLWLLLRSNARTRKPFEGVAALYRALQAGVRGDEGNPIFYVSSSPWNLYAPLVEYLDLQGIPVGPLLLKDFGDHTLFASADHGTHKLASIERILATYPALDYVLIGDSGEQDPEIYAEVVRRHPRRIRTIYIRSVNTAERRMAAIDRLTTQVRDSGAQLVLAPDSAFAAVHAASEGLIASADLGSVREEQERDHAGDDPPARTSETG